jgi:hypothetical protein
MTQERLEQREVRDLDEAIPGQSWVEAFVVPIGTASYSAAGSIDSSSGKSRYATMGLLPLRISRYCGCGLSRLMRFLAMGFDALGEATIRIPTAHRRRWPKDFSHEF